MAYYKDFSKDVKDLLAKNYSDAGKWKIESKFKGPKDTLYVNPAATSAGVTVDVEYNLSACPTKVKVNVTPAGNFKTTLTYEDKGHKGEIVVSQDLAFELSHEAKFGKLAVHEKLVKANGKDGAADFTGEFGGAFKVIDTLQIGAGVAYPFSGKNVSWTAGARWADAGRIVSVATAQLQSYTTQVLFPFKVADTAVTGGVQVDCGNGDFKAQVGVDVACPCVKGAALRVRVNKDLKWAVAYIAKLSDNWKAAVSLNAALKPGLLLTRE